MKRTLQTLVVGLVLLGAVLGCGEKGSNVPTKKEAAPQVTDPPVSFGSPAPDKAKK